MTAPAARRSLTFGSLFAGIGGFDAGFEAAGMTCRWQVEKDAAARGVLARHWPDVPRFEDVRHCGADNLEQVDVICGGFPCQDLSVAGQRRGLAGARSGLFYEMTRICDELRPVVIVWENVPGLLSSRGGRDFFAVLAELDRIGFDGGWTTLDAQYFGVPQRRQRVFGVFVRRDLGAAGERAAEILALASRLHWHPEAGRAARKGTPSPAGRSATRGGKGVASALTTNAGRRPRGDGSDNLIPFSFRASANSSQPVRAGGIAGALGTTKYDAIAFSPAQITSPQNGANPRPGDPAPTISASAHHPHCVAFGGNRVSGERAGDSALTAHHGRLDFETETFVVAGALRASQGGPDDNAAQAGHLVIESARIAPTLGACSYSPTKSPSGQMLDFAIAVAERGRADGRNVETQERISYALTAPAKGGRTQEGRIATQAGVRRLTPVEYERLMGDPDNWTAETDQGPQSDSQRYRQIGNQVARPVAEWLGRQIVTHMTEVLS